MTNNFTEMHSTCQTILNYPYWNVSKTLLQVLVEEVNLYTLSYLQVIHIYTDLLLISNPLLLLVPEWKFFFLMQVMPSDNLLASPTLAVVSWKQIIMSWTQKNYAVKIAHLKWNHLRFFTCIPVPWILILLLIITSLS